MGSRASPVGRPAPFWRPTWAEIDAGAFRHNVRALASVLPPRVRILAVLKADGYGHGAVAMAQAARGAGLGRRLWGFGVSMVEEGVALRDAGLTDRILVLGSLYPFESYDAVLDRDLTPTVASRASALALAQRAEKRGRPATCHVKIDTGMGRIGMAPATARDTLAALRHNPWLKIEALYTHLACADSETATAAQLRVFDALASDLGDAAPPLRHAANSGGALARPRSRYDLVRPGIALYGVPPWPGAGRGLGLRPVLSWKSRVAFVKTVAKGTPLSYGWTWRARRRSRIATLPVGYADGYRRDLTGRGEALVRGRRCPVVGRVTMDQILLDVTGLAGVDAGEEAVLLGEQGGERISAQELADRAGTISYEILCGISARVPRVPAI